MALTVNGLRLWLAALKVDGNCLVVLASDAEGNRYSPLAEMSLGVYHPEKGHSGEVYIGEPVREENDTEAVVLWPVNCEEATEHE